jgi:hypothetical protein
MGTMRLRPVKKRALKVGVFNIAATSVSTGTGLSWRIMTTDENTGVQHEFVVDEGKIYQVQFQKSPPWSHETPFVIGGRVKLILASEKRAIQRAVMGWS